MSTNPFPLSDPTPVPPVSDWMRLTDETVGRLTGPVPRPAIDSSQIDLPGYEILGVLGRGGVGVVYKARQRDLGRIVALKMLLAGRHSDPTSLARFRSEGAAIARLQHPNIVQIFEVGDHEGLPYLVLEYVSGGGLDAWLRYHTPTPQQAAGLVETVARAVHVAHRSGIIHRDLKPANILLAPVSGRDEDHSPPEAGAKWSPKVTDFGLAKRVEDAAGLTQTGTVLGTPAYMAPEQLGTRRTGVGPAADVYALGVILYEMVAGRPPFVSGDAADVIVQVGLREPITPRYWRPRLPRDLETICLKCLRKDPRERYATAQDLADDLRRFLDHKPVIARPINPLARAGRWCRRHPLTTGLVMLVGLLVGTVATLAVAGELAAQAGRAATEQARQDAEAREHDARAALDRESRRRQQLQQVLGAMAPALLDDLLENEPELTPDHRTLLEKVAAVYREFAEDVREGSHGADAAATFGSLGRINHRLGHAADAERAFREAVRLFDASPTFDHRRGAGVFRIELARLLLTDPKRTDEAGGVLREGKAMLWQLLAEVPDDVAAREALARGCVVEAGLQRPKNPAVAERLLCQAASLEATLIARRPDAVQERRAFALTLHELSQVESDLKRPDQWEACLQVALNVLESLPPHVVPPPAYAQPLATIHNDLGIYYTNARRLPEAEAQFLGAVSNGEKLVSLFPGVPEHAVLLGGSYTNLGSVVAQMGRGELALDWHRKALNVLIPVHDKDSNCGKVRLFLRNTFANRAGLLDAMKKPAEAVPDWHWVVLLSTGPEKHQYLAREAHSMISAGDVLGASRTAEAAMKTPSLDPATFYTLAAVWALVGKSHPDQSPERETCLTRSVALLRVLHDAGVFKSPDHLRVLRQDESFDLLRNRDDFRSIFGNVLK